MKVGEYVRTDNCIGKVYDICHKEEDYYKFIIEKHGTLKICDSDYIVKSSPNIIDLIEVGDYVNGYKVTYVANEEPCPSGKFVDIDCDKDSSDSYFFDNDIKTIVTHEQFSQMEYRIGE